MKQFDDENQTSTYMDLFLLAINFIAIATFRFDNFCARHIIIYREYSVCIHKT